MNSLMRYTPVLPTFGSLRREVDRLFDEFFNDHDFFDGHDEGMLTALWSPRADISETDDHYVLRVDVPGLSKKDLSVELLDNTLTVSGERKTEHEEKQESVRRIERSYGRFFRSFTLPYAGNPDKVKARVKNGVLTIEVPKSEASRPRRIDIS